MLSSAEVAIVVRPCPTPVILVSFSLKRCKLRCVHASFVGSTGVPCCMVLMAHARDERTQAIGGTLKQGGGSGSDCVYRGPRRHRNGCPPHEAAAVDFIASSSQDLFDAVFAALGGGIVLNRNRCLQRGELPLPLAPALSARYPCWPSADSNHARQHDCAPILRPAYGSAGEVFAKWPSCAP